MLDNGSSVTMFGKHGTIETVNASLGIAKISFDKDTEGNKVATDGWYGFRYQTVDGESKVVWTGRQFS